MFQVCVFYLAPQLNTNCLNKRATLLALIPSPKLACQDPVIGLLLPSMASAMAITVAFATYIVAGQITCIIFTVCHISFLF